MFERILTNVYKTWTDIKVQILAIFYVSGNSAYNSPTVVVFTKRRLYSEWLTPTIGTLSLGDLLQNVPLPQKSPTSEFSRCLCRFGSVEEHKKVQKSVNRVFALMGGFQNGRFLIIARVHVFKGNRSS